MTKEQEKQLYDIFGNESTISFKDCYYRMAIVNYGPRTNEFYYQINRVSRAQTNKKYTEIYVLYPTHVINNSSKDFLKFIEMYFFDKSSLDKDSHSYIV